MNKSQLEVTIIRRKWLIKNKNNLPPIKDLIVMFNITADAIRKDLQKLELFEKTYSIIDNLNQFTINQMLKEYQQGLEIKTIIENYNITYNSWQIITLRHVKPEILAKRNLILSKKWRQENRSVKQIKPQKKLSTNKNVWDFSGENYDIPPAKYRMSAITNNTDRVG
jgi:hypothetical protein